MSKPLDNKRFEAAAQILCSSLFAATSTELRIWVVFNPREAHDLILCS